MSIGRYHIRCETDGTTFTRPWDGQPIVAGRDHSCPLRIPSADVSRRHVRLSIDETEQLLCLEDLGSANGTWVDGREHNSASIPLPAAFVLGHHVRVRIEAQRTWPLRRERIRVLGLGAAILVLIGVLLRLEAGPPSEPSAPWTYEFQTADAEETRLPELEPKQWAEWASQRMHDDTWAPEALGESIRALERSSPSTAVQEKRAALEAEFAARLRRTEFAIMRAAALGHGPSLERFTSYYRRLNAGRGLPSSERAEQWLNRLLAAPHTLGSSP